MKTETSKGSQSSHVSTGAPLAAPEGLAPQAPNASPAGTAAPPPQPEAPAAQPAHRYRKWLVAAGIVAALAVGAYYLIPWLNTALNTVSTDDAYVNGHVTMVAPRVSGEVATVLVDDNMRVKKGDLLVQLDKEPFQVQVALKRAAVGVGEANLRTAESQARSLMATAGAQRWKIQTASQLVKNQVALLNARVATLRSREATLDRAQADLGRGEALVLKGGLSKEDLDRRRQDVRIAQAALTQAREEIFQVRATLGLMPQPEKGKELTDVPADLEETFSDVRAAFSELVQTMTQLGVPLAPTKATPREAIAEFHRRDKNGDLDRILSDLLPKVPGVVQAKAQLTQARHDLEQAELNLRYCDVISQIDGVVTSRNVNPGNNLQAGQVVMAVRSVTEIWIDANFKETQLADLRIGQRVRCEVDMYGDKKEFEGRITGFTMGTGQTLALLPPQNATGNFVKIVQRLPVRVELTDYEAAKAPLFVGLSVTPYVYYKEPPKGPHAGEVLQPSATLPTRPSKY